MRTFTICDAQRKRGDAVSSLKVTDAIKIVEEICSGKVNAEWEMSFLSIQREKISIVISKAKEVEVTKLKDKP